MDHESKHAHYSVTGYLTDAGGSNGPISQAEVRLYEVKKGNRDPIELECTGTNHEGRFRFSHPLEDQGTYYVEGTAFGLKTQQAPVKARATGVQLDLPLDLTITPHAFVGDSEKLEKC